MLINGVTIKEKSIEVYEFMPSPKMQLNMNKTNLMPPKVEVSKDFNCVIKLEVKLKDESGKDLVCMKVSYLILAVLEDGEIYNQEKTADSLFNQLESMYIKSINDLIRETPFPPLPLHIKC